MSQVLEIPDPVYSALEKAAQAEGTTPAGWIADQLAKTATPLAKPAPNRSLADRFDGRIGRIRSTGETNLSEHCGERFAEHLEAKKQAGHL